MTRTSPANYSITNTFCSVMVIVITKGNCMGIAFKAECAGEESTVSSQNNV